MKTYPDDSVTGFMSSESGPNHGLTIRAHFAAMAMQGLVANAALADMSARQVAEQAAVQADTLIEALNK